MFVVLRSVGERWAMTLIFLSYRRSDSKHPAARIHAIFSRFFGRQVVFFDVKSIPQGAHFPRYLEEALHQARVVLVLIGPGWLVNAQGQRRLNEADDFVRRELEIALARGSACEVVPLLIDGATMPSAAELPPTLWRLPSLNAVTLNADPHFDREVRRLAHRLAKQHDLPLRQSAQALINRFMSLYKRQAYREALDTLERIAQHPDTLAIFDVEAQRRHVLGIIREQEYGLLLAMLRAQLPNEELRRAYERFRAQFGDYDPQGIGARVRPARGGRPDQPAGDLSDGAGGGQLGRRVLPALAWQPIKAGVVRVGPQLYSVLDFRMSRSVVRSADYELFVRAQDGYRNPEWWSYSPQAQAWRAAHPQPIPPAFKGDDLPRTNLAWYDAQAFSLWLSYQLQRPIGLPSEAQWQRAALGDQLSGYPWGADFDPSRLCYGGQPRPASVLAYPQGDSPWGVRQLCGGVWEWCSSESQDDDPNAARIVRGGAYSSSAEETHPLHRAALPPQAVRSDVGLRLILLED